MAWELRFLVNGSVIVYCACVSRLMRIIYQDLFTFQEFYGYMKEIHDKDDPRSFTEDEYENWYMVETNDSSVDPRSIYRDNYKECGEYSFKCLPRKSQIFLQETYGYYPEITESLRDK